MLVDIETDINSRKSILSPSHYYEDSIFKKEEKLIFDKTWQFACFLRDLKNSDDYVTVDYCGKSVVIKNFGGELKAFLNVCSHRFSRLCSNKKGNGFLQCPYHGWTYDKEGYPYAIPLRKEFESLDMEELKLTAFSVAVCGEFVFIRKTQKGPDLESFLGDLGQSLLNISDGLGDIIDVNQMDINANWKIVVENTLEAYHVRKVHPESIAKMGLNERDYCFSLDHSFLDMDVKNSLSGNRRLFDAFSSRSFKINGYQHYLVFPAMTIATTYGTTFSIQKITPLSASKTRFTTTIFCSKLSGEKNALVRAYEQSVIDLNKHIFDEDKVICEEVQYGIEMTDKKYSPLCEKEQRILSFQIACSEYMNDA